MRDSSVPLTCLACTSCWYQVERIAALDGMENCETVRAVRRGSARSVTSPDCLVRCGAGSSRRLTTDEALASAVRWRSAAPRCRAGVICINVSVLRRPGLQMRTCASHWKAVFRRSRGAAVCRPPRTPGITPNDELLRRSNSSFGRRPRLGARTAAEAARRALNDLPAQSTPRSITAGQDAAAQPLSNLAMRLEPRCELDDVVLPTNERAALADRARRAVRAHVLDGWKFGEQLATAAA